MPSISQKGVELEPPGGLTDWFRRFRTPLRRFLARHRGVSASDIDDVAQEVFLRLLRYKPEEHVLDPKSYLYKMAANVASEWSMRARARHPHASNWLDELSDDANPVEAVYSIQRNATINAALARLPARSREVLRLRFGEGLTDEGVAERLRLSQRVVRRDLATAYVRLRALLSRRGNLSHHFEGKIE